MSIAEPLIDNQRTSLKRIVADAIDERRDTIVTLSQEIHADPEVSWEEHRAAVRIADVLRAEGFEVEVGVYGVETAIEATFGDGPFVVAICAESDALPSVGHGCGHNMIAAAGVGAAISLARVAREAGIRVKLLGTPAEEHGGGKVPMLVGGAWEDATASLMVHGIAGDDIRCRSFTSTAVDRFQVQFSGHAAHAAASPERAVNAGAASTLALTAIGLLRQHISKNSSVNAFVSLGGAATNIIPGETVLQVEVRAADIDDWRDLKKKTLACFEGAAVATGCSWRYEATEHPYAPMVHHEPLADLWDANMRALGRFADDVHVNGGGSTDMGNVSRVVPSIHGMVAILGSDATLHNAEFAAAAASPAGDQAVIDGATALAWTVLDAALDIDIRNDLLARQAARIPGSTQTTLVV